MARLHALGFALIAAAAPAALSQEAGPEPAAPAAPAAPAVQDLSIDVTGVRARVVLRRGTALEGLLPLGTRYWEKASPGADYEETDASDAAAGLRLYFVLGMEGAIFFRKSDIAEVKDLGVISDEAAAAIRRNLLDARRAALLEKEARLKESLVKILGTDRAEPETPAASTAPGAPEPSPAGAAPAVEPAPAPAAVPAVALPSGPLTREEQAKAKAEARRARGEELLLKYPPPDWSEKRLETILWREQVAKIPPDEVEAPFVKESDLWLEALRRREEAEKKAAAPAASGTNAGSPAPR